MGLDVQARAILTGANRMGQEIFGTKAAGTSVLVNYNDGQFIDVPAYYSPLKSMKKTEEAGSLEDHDCTVRMAKSALPIMPKDGDSLSFVEEGTTGNIFRNMWVESIGGTHPLSVEWVLGCRASN